MLNTSALSTSPVTDLSLTCRLGIEDFWLLRNFIALQNFFVSVVLRFLKYARLALRRRDTTLFLTFCTVCTAEICQDCFSFCVENTGCFVLLIALSVRMGKPGKVLSLWENCFRNIHLLFPEIFCAKDSNSDLYQSCLKRLVPVGVIYHVTCFVKVSFGA